MYIHFLIVLFTVMLSGQGGQQSIGYGGGYGQYQQQGENSPLFFTAGSVFFTRGCEGTNRNPVGFQILLVCSANFELCPQIPPELLFLSCFMPWLLQFCPVWLSSFSTKQTTVNSKHCLLCPESSQKLTISPLAAHCTSSLLSTLPLLSA